MTADMKRVKRSHTAELMSWWRWSWCWWPPGCHNGGSSLFGWNPASLLLFERLLGRICIAQDHGRFSQAPLIIVGSYGLCTQVVSLKYWFPCQNTLPYPTLGLGRHHGDKQTLLPWCWIRLVATADPIQVVAMASRSGGSDKCTPGVVDTLMKVEQYLTTGQEHPHTLEPLNGFCFDD